jgi:hypothetical protein
MAKKHEPEEQPERRPPKKLSTFGPESGPSGEVVIDADAPAEGVRVVEDEPDPKAARAQAKAQKLASAEGKARRVKVEVVRMGYIGHKRRRVGEVFTLDLAAGQKLPSWVKPVADDLPSTSIAHSAEAGEEVVDDEGKGHPAVLKDVL